MARAKGTARLFAVNLPPFEIIVSRIKGVAEVTTLSEVDIGPEEKRLVLEHVIKSHTFSRSDQLKRFLQYICDKEIEGKADEINEYSIAVEALGRPADYSPADDSSVRTRAHALRQKLQEYYELENSAAQVRIDVPKGAYNPRFFYQVSAATPVSAALLLSPASQSEAPRILPWKPFLAGGVSALVMTALALSFIPRWRGAIPKPGSIDPVVAQAWGQMLNRGEQVEICIGTPPAMLLHSYKDGELPPGPMLLLPAGKEVSAWYERLQMMDGGGRLYMHTTQDVFLFGDSLAATSAVQLLSKAGALPQVIPESNLRAFALRGRNVVLIGSPNYSPLAARFLLNTPFSVRYDPVNREEVVSDGPPERGAKRVFRPAHDEFGMLTKAYGLITVLPSEPGGEGGAQIVIFSGITSAGPQAALEFFRSPEGLRILEAKLQKDGYHKFPQAYQVVVRCGLDHNLALNWEYETHQVMKGSPLLN